MDRVVSYPFQTAELPWLINGGPILTTYESSAMILQVYQGLLYVPHKHHKNMWMMIMFKTP